MVALLALSACAKPDPTRISFPAHSQMSVVLMHVEPARISYVLNLASFDDRTQTLDGVPFNKVITFKVDDPEQLGYVAVVARPGTYVFKELIQQNIWTICFGNETKSFTVHANEAVFLGDFQPNVHLLQVEKLAAEHGDMKGYSGAKIHYFDDEIIPPQITTPGLDTADFLAAKQYETALMPMLQGRLQPVQYHPAIFRGYALTGARVCGGWIKDEVEQAQ